VEDGKMVNRGSDPRSSLTPRPLHPFTCLVGNDDRPESFKLKPASEPLRAYQFARDAAEELPWLEVNRARRWGPSVRRGILVILGISSRAYFFG